ncbi:ATP-binding protein [Paracidovorax oryzae]|uniref:ATP-binding protein n=1 Tax=Paracidovorax oryzae TaxID=862720 RepID=UPI00258A77D5
MSYPSDPHDAKALSDQIRVARDSDDLDRAVALCRKAIHSDEKSPFFRRLLADLLFEQRDFSGAFIALADYLSVAPTSQRAHFAKRYARFRRVLSPEEMATYVSQLDSALSDEKINIELAGWAKRLIQNDLPVVPINPYSPLGSEFLEKIGDDAHFDRVVKLGRHLEQQAPAVLSKVLDDIILPRLRRMSTYRIDQFCASIYERWEKYDSALIIVSELLLLKDDPVATRSLFRICRLTLNYERADALIARRPHLLKSDEFNVLYELIYYFEERDDFAQVEAVLRKIEGRFKQNLPVLRTVRNFYVRFGMLEHAKSAEAAILDLSRRLATKDGSADLLATVAESESEVMTSKMEELYSELEHQKQLAAISDLTTGISHELGQPITNIRYTIQFYKRLFQRGMTPEQVMTVFDSVLEETNRMGGLISRLSPLTSSRSVIEKFDVIDRIKTRFAAETARLSAESISVKLPHKSPIFIEGDPVKFDQLVSNLLINSIDAIRERKESRPNIIEVSVAEKGNEVHMTFSDTGTGVPFKSRNTIFDPFFTTKPPGKGEGLGLFIVWNLLKMQGGSIAVDRDYRKGAQFNIIMKKYSNIKEVFS